MQVIPPETITDLTLVSSTAAEPAAPAVYSAGTTYAKEAIVYVAADFTIYQSLADGNLGHPPISSPIWWEILGPTETAYNPATTYAAGDTAYSPTAHRVYESLVAGNVGNPLPVLPETLTTKWQDVGPTNRFRMFDLLRNTQTVTASPLTAVINPAGIVTAIGLVGLEGTSAQVDVTLAGVNVYSHTEPLTTRDVADWYEFFTTPFETKHEFALFDLPAYLGSQITVTVTNTGGNAAIGGIPMGAAKYLGKTLREVELDLQQFSLINRDVFGNAELTPRRSIPTTEQRVLIWAADVAGVVKTLVDLDAVPALWSALDDADHILFQPLLILGIYRNARFAMADPDCVLTLKLEEI